MQISFLHIIGPPGSSKTLSLRIIVQSMKGQNSLSEFLKKYPIVDPTYYQGHIHCTPERVQEMIHIAQKKQEQFNKQYGKGKFISVLVFDEVGLAEISPLNPLKVIHEPLENSNFSFVGLSNWPLDASKMNRTLTIYRYFLNYFLNSQLRSITQLINRLNLDQKSLNDIFDSAHAEIEEQYKDDVFIKQELTKCSMKQFKEQNPISLVYINYTKDLKTNYKQFSNFHGNRDFYSVVNYVWDAQLEQIKSLKQNQRKDFNYSDVVTRAYFRHFSGLEESQGLLKKHLEDQQIISTETYDPLQSIRQNINERYNVLTKRHLLIITNDLQNTTQFLKNELSNKPHKFFIGSDFEEDKQAQFSYSILNLIISCIDAGITIVLQSLDSIYQCLYEVLNQSYRRYNGKYYCKISLGSESIDIQVSDNFKLILLATQKDVEKMDGPLINRFEKHLLTHSFIISSLNIKSQYLKDYLNGIQSKNKSIKQVYPLQSVSIPLFRFSNLDSIVQSYCLQLLFEKRKENIQSTLNNDDYKKIFKRLFHLSDFYNMYPLSKQSRDDSLYQKNQQKYIQGHHHDSLLKFIETKISFGRKHQESINLFGVLSPSDFSERGQIQNECQHLVLNSVKSQNNLEKYLTEFLSLKNLGISAHQKAQTDHKITQNINQPRFQLSEQVFQMKKKILLIQADISRRGGDSANRIILTMQSIQEQIVLLNHKLDKHKEAIREYSLYILLLIKVDDNFEMIPINGKWKFYYIENLQPFNQFLEENIDTDLMNVMSSVKRNLRLSNIMSRPIIITNLVSNFDDLILFFIHADSSLRIAYDKIKYQTEDQNYRWNKFQQINKIFQKESLFFDRVIRLISNQTIIIMKNKYKIETVDELIQQYLLEKKLLFSKYPSLHNAILESLKRMVIKSLKVTLYLMEKNGLIYSLANCTDPKDSSYQKILFNEIEKCQDSFRKKFHFKDLDLKMDCIVLGFEDIISKLNGLEKDLAQLQENNFKSDDLYEFLIKTAKNLLYKYEATDKILTNYSYLIINDIQNQDSTLSNQFCNKKLDIIKAILLIKEAQNQQDSNLQVYILGLDKYQGQTDCIIHYFVASLIFKESINQIQNLFERYEGLIDQNNIIKLFININTENNRNKNMNTPSESLNLLNAFVAREIYKQIKPSQKVMATLQLSGEQYTDFVSHYIKFLEKNSLTSMYYEVQLFNKLCSEFGLTQDDPSIQYCIKLGIIQNLSIDYDELEQVKNLIQNSFLIYQNPNNNNQEDQGPQRQTQFILKWNSFVQQLILFSLKKPKESQQLRDIIKLFQILILLEEEEEQQIKGINNKFKIFLNKVFIELSNILTFESIKQLFDDIQSTKQIKVKDEYREYYTFLIFGQVLQNKFLNKQSGQLFDNCQYFLEQYSRYAQTNQIQQTIYLSIFRQLIYLICQHNDYQVSVPKKIQEQNSKLNQEKQKSRILLQNISERTNSLDSFLKQHFNSLQNDDLKIFVAKQIIYTGQEINDYIKNSFYFKNCEWLQNLAGYNLTNLSETYNSYVQLDLQNQTSYYTDFLQAMNSNQDQSIKFKSKLIEFYKWENNDRPKISFRKSLRYCSNIKHGLDQFLHQFTNDKRKFPLLNYYYGKSKEIQLITKALYQFIYFHQNCMEQLQNKIDFSQANQETMYSFTRNKNDLQLLNKFYENRFIDNWNDARNYAMDYFQGFDEISIISIETKLSKLLYSSNQQTNNNNNPSEFYIFLNKLCELQNNLIEEFIQGCIDHQNLHFENLNIQNLKRETKLEDIQIIQIVKRAEVSILELFVSHGLEERDGIDNKFTFDYDGFQTKFIEDQFLHTNKIDFKRSTEFQFLCSINDVEYNSDFQQNNKNELPNGIIQFFQESWKTNKQGMISLLNQLYTIQKHVSHRFQETTIRDAMILLKIQNSVKDFNLIFNEQIRVKHLSHLIQLFEELTMDELVNIYQQPMKYAYNKSLIESIKDKFLQTEVKDQIKYAIGRFIIRELSQNGDSQNYNNLFFQSYQECIKIPSQDKKLIETYQEFRELKIGDCYQLYKSLKDSEWNNFNDNNSFYTTNNHLKFE